MSSDAPAITRDEALDLLYLEARLLDDGRLAEWLELFTEDCVYWVPNVVEDAAREPSIIYDTRTRMDERVHRLTQTAAHAQSPPSRTQHTVCNVEVLAADTPGEATVLCHLVIFEQRPGDDWQVGLGAPRWFAGRCEYRLRVRDRTWKIALKKVNLLDRDLPQYNLTFVI
ncbi:MAG: aromatic-ring-hydroxylating dioxygenase subunit beta [Nitriliruptorales bacterium]|nr:aromatic-ring-hydroxylating dioxygenase subunit beta [Nitriliruptorales bacterium]